MSVTRFFGALVMVLGVGLILGCGGCAVTFLPVLSHDGLDIQLVLLWLFGGPLPALGGLGVVWAGWRMWKEDAGRK